MCQFLPQDRVQDFAKQNPQELLISTQMSVCRQEMIDSHKQLMALRAEQNTGTNRVHVDKRRLQEIEERLKILKTCVEDVQRKNALVEKRAMCLKKKAWMIYEREYEICQKLVRDLKIAKK